MNRLFASEGCDYFSGTVRHPVFNGMFPEDTLVWADRRGLDLDFLSDRVAGRYVLRLREWDPGMARHTLELDGMEGHALLPWAPSGEPAAAFVGARLLHPALAALAEAGLLPEGRTADGDGVVLAFGDAAGAAAAAGFLSARGFDSRAVGASVSVGWEAPSR